jgi:hypothetical protein
VLPLLSAEQRQVVIRVLEFACAYNTWDAYERAEIIFDIKTAIQAVWTA